METRLTESSTGKHLRCLLFRKTRRAGSPLTRERSNSVLGMFGSVESLCVKIQEK
jgi:hypothetical protein